MKVKTQSKKVDKAWLNQHLTDPWVRLAQQEGYRSRAAYKLQQIDAALHLLRPGQWVLDLGCAPGAWSQYLRRRLLHKAAAGAHPGLLIGLDLQPMEPIEGVRFIQGDFTQPEVLAQLEQTLAQAAQEANLAARPRTPADPGPGARVLDLVLSDMAPNLSGIASVDAARGAHLVELALVFAVRHLKRDGALVAKVFHGAAYDSLVRALRAEFRSVKAFKPQASRAHSAETFLIGQGLSQAM